MNKHRLSPKDIEKVTIHTFKRATMLSKIVPKTADEAQYNIAYPVASALVYGDFGLLQILEKNLHNSDVIDMMSRLSFVVDKDIDARFPEKRICKAEIVTKSGERFVSEGCEPRGEAKENISLSWLCDKFHRITGSVLTEEGIENILPMLTSDEDLPIREIVDRVNKESYWKEI